MKKLSTVTFFIFYFLFSVGDNAFATDCTDVLELAGRDIVDFYKQTLNEYGYYEKFCSQFDEQKKKGAALNIGIPVKGGKHITFGGSREYKNAVYNAVCQVKNEKSKDEEYWKVLLNVANPQAIAAWAQCVKLKEKGIKYSIKKVGSSNVKISTSFIGAPGVDSVVLTGGLIEGATCTGQLKSIIDKANNKSNIEEIILKAGGDAISMICKREKFNGEQSRLKEFVSIITFSNMQDLEYVLTQDPRPIDFTPHCSELLPSDSRNVRKFSGNSHGPDGKPVSCDNCGNCSYGPIPIFSDNTIIDAKCIIDLIRADKAVKGHDCGGTAYHRETTHLTYIDKNGKAQTIRVDGACNKIKKKFGLTIGCD